MIFLIFAALSHSAFHLHFKDDCLETTRARNPTVYQAPQTFILSLLQPFLVWSKTSSFNISHFSRSFNLVGHQDLTGEKPIFLMLYLTFIAMFQNDGERILNMTNGKLLYTDVTTILHAVH